MRLGLDIGTNSIGWWLYKTASNKDIIEHIAGGVRIFSDGRNPKSGQSLTVARREARSSRRMRDRYLRRRTVLMEKLSTGGLMPENPAERKALELLNPYELRDKGLSEKLPLSHLGRAIFHLNQRRGFKSNRKTDANDNEGGKIKEGAARLEIAMMADNSKTYGQFLNKRLKKDSSNPIRTRLGMVKSEDGKESSGYNFYPTRDLFEREFETLWDAQVQYYPEILTDDLHDEIQRIIFFQRPLKEQKVGNCFFEEESRLAKAHPLFQELRLYQTINALRVKESNITDRPLSIKERDTLILFARKKKKATFAGMRRALKLRPDQTFTLERGNRKDIDGDEIEAAFCKSYGSNWASLDLDQKWSIIQTIRNAEDNELLVAKLQSDYDVDTETAEEMAKVRLPDGYGRLGETASRKILKELIRDVVLYSTAASEIYGSHSDDSTGEVFEHLPYYGEVLQRHIIPGSFDVKQHDPDKNAAEYWGRITNPTVHIGLNQLRLLVNDILDIYGKPNKIVVELARDLKNSDAQKIQINKNIKKATEAAQKRSEKLEELGIKNTGDARMRLRLWEESHHDATKRCCPYCCKPIGVKNALDGIQMQIDHILPYSRTLDDSPSNKVLCHAVCNQEKRNRTPFEVWGSNPELWEKISANMKNLPDNKSWRFGPDAMDKFEGDRHFESRQLVDTQYLSRIARTYLSKLYPEKGSAPVQVVPGQLTEMLRRKWGLNEFLHDAELAGKEKNRQDHRHHAIDAAVIAATDAGLLQRVSKSAARNVDKGRSVLKNIEPPFGGFRDGLKRILERITISHKQDHGSVGTTQKTSGQLHNDTAYGLLEGGLVVTRKPFDTLKPNDISKIRDVNLRNILSKKVEGLAGKDHENELKRFSEIDHHYRGIRRVRIVEKLNTIPIKDKDGKSYKGYKGDSNHCVEVWRLPDGTWKSIVLTTFEANSNGLGSTRPQPTAKLIMRLYSKDQVAIEHPKLGSARLIIAKIDKNNIVLYQNNEANVDARHRDKNDPFKYVNVGLGTIKKYQLRKIGVDRLGRITDPGPFDS